MHHTETGDRQIISALLNQTSLCIGPLESFHTPIGASKTDDDYQWFMSPADAVSTVIPLPIPEHVLLAEYELDPQELVYLHRLWMKSRTEIWKSK